MRGRMLAGNRSTSVVPVVGDPLARWPDRSPGWPPGAAGRTGRSGCGPRSMARSKVRCGQVEVVEGGQGVEVAVLLLGVGRRAVARQEGLVLAGAAGGGHDVQDGRLDVGVRGVPPVAAASKRAAGLGPDGRGRPRSCRGCAAPRRAATGCARRRRRAGPSRARSATGPEQGADGRWPARAGRRRGRPGRTGRGRRSPPTRHSGRARPSRPRAPASRSRSASGAWPARAAAQVSETRL